MSVTARSGSPAEHDPTLKGSPLPTRPVTIIAVCGTYEKADDSGLLGNVTRGLPGVPAVWVEYPAAYGDGMSYRESYTAGVQRTRWRIADAIKAGNDVVLLGYSQGAAIAGDVAYSIACGNGPCPSDRVRLVGLVADPYRSSTDEPRTAIDHGIGGARTATWGSLTGRVLSYAAPADLIAACPAGFTLLRDAAVASQSLLLGTPDTFPTAVTAIAATAFGRLPWWEQAFVLWTQWGPTTAAIDKHNATGAHSSYAITGGPGGVPATAHLAAAIRSTL